MSASEQQLQPFPATPTLRRKVLNVMAAVGYVQKRGRNQHFKYNYATEADVAEKVRAALIAEGVLFIPSVESVTQRGNITEVMLNCRLLDVDSDEEILWTMPGAGQDPGDKGPYKAVTGAEKYALMKLLLIATGDDPEADTGTPPSTDDPPREEPDDGPVVDLAEEMRKADTPPPPAEPEWKTTPQGERISEGKLRRLHAIIGQASGGDKQERTNIEKALIFRVRKEFGLNSLADLPWRGKTYETVVSWLDGGKSE